jgi:hypothetical protein
MGFFVNGMLGGYGALMSELYPTSARATAQNVLFNIGRAVGGLRPVAVGAVSASYGFETAIALLAALYVLDILALWFLIPERRGAKVTGAGTRGPRPASRRRQLDIMGPLGVGFHARSKWRHIVAVGRGAGLATLAPLAKARKPTAPTSRRSSARGGRSCGFGRSVRSHGAEVIAVTDSERPAGRPMSSAFCAA